MKPKSVHSDHALLIRQNPDEPLGRSSSKAAYCLTRLGSSLALALTMLLVTFLWLIGPAQSLLAATSGVRYVVPAPLGDDQGGANDCSESLFPCATIQQAVDQAGDGEEIRVAAGRYTDFNVQGSLTQTIYLDKNVILSGGFTTTNWVTSAPRTNLTIVDAGGNGRVIYVSSAVSATVEGFYLTGGFVSDDNGGAVNNQFGTLILRNNEIYSNNIVATTADVGASGAGIATAGTAMTILSNNRIYSNTATNGADLADGGGLSIDGGGTVNMNANEVFGNSADNIGGGIIVLNGSLYSANNLIYNNTAFSGGGGIASDLAQTIIKNDTIYGNTATDSSGVGGGILHSDRGTLLITNTLIISNSAGSSGGGILSSSPVQTLTITHTDFYGNTPDDFAGGMPDPTLSGSNRDDQDPNFVDPAAFNLHLSAGSPARDSGTSVNLTTDFEGEGRPFGAVIDRGADEFTDSSAECFARVQSGQVFTNVQAAIDAASDGNEVKVAGRCIGVDTVNSLTQTAYITKGITLRGGYSSSDWETPSYGPSILDANGLGRVIYITGAEEINPIIENFLIRNGGGVDDGAGVFVGGNANAVLRNNVIYQNTANGSGGGVYNNGSSGLTLEHNTIYSNTATVGGGVYAGNAGGGEQVVARSNIIADNQGNGLQAAAGGLFSLAYNNVIDNDNQDYGVNLSPASTDISVAPDFKDPSADDFSLNLSSALINAADPSSAVTTDFQNDPRPQGSRADIGADESLFYTEVVLSEAAESPKVVTDTAVVANTVVTFTHTLTNLGQTPTMSDTFDLDIINTGSWSYSLLDIASPVSLDDGDSVTFRVAVTVPGTVSLPLYNETIITATSQTNGATFATVTDLIAAPGLELTPSYTQTANPGEIITYTHTLRNSGPITDSVLVDINSVPFGWGTQLVPAPGVSLTLSAGETTPVIVRVVVTDTAPAGLSEVITVTATSIDFGVTASVTDSTTAKGTTGDRYVSTGGVNTNNNCTVKTQPCRTINYALGQAAFNDTVRVAQGVYNESGGIVLKDKINLLGGFSSNFNGGQTGSPADTVIDVQNTGRGLWINVPVLLPPTVDNLTIKNGSPSGVGGGIYVQGNSAPTLTNLIIQDSSATRGGGIYIDKGNPVLDTVTISGTTATGWGGGIYMNGGSPSLRNVVISSTSAVNGGGIYVTGGSPVITGSTIFNGNATSGGGVYHAAGTLTISQTRVSSNRADAGGGFYNNGGTLNLWNNFVYSNTSSVGAGGSVYNNATLKLINNTLYGNQAATFGGGVFDNNTAGLVLANTIFASNSAPSGGGAFYRSDSGTIPASVSYNHYDNNSPGNSNVSIGSNFVTGDPLFVDVSSGDFHLTADSPAVDAADPGTTLRSDIDNDFRPINQGFDIGADELSGCLARVKEDPTKKIYGVLQEAIDAAQDGHTVQISGVCRGTQSRQISGQTLNQTAFVSRTLTLEGGYNSDFSNNPETNPVTTTLDAQGEGRVLVVSNAIVVDVFNLTLTGGDAANSGQTSTGGGVYNENTQLRMNEVRVVSNQANAGAGLYNISGTLVISESDILSNTAASTGGGGYNASGIFRTEAITAALNSAVDGAAFANASGGQLTIERSFLHSNGASGSGGAVFNPSGGILNLINTIVANNDAVDGGGLYNLANSLTVRHDTFYLNTASGQGGGIYHSAGSTAPIINSTILISNTAPVDSGGGIYSADADPSFDYNDVVGNTGGDYGGNLTAGDGAANITVDPNFQSTVLTATNFLRISSGSPAEDQGDPASPIIVDIEQDPRPSNQNPDIGVDEVSGCYARLNTEPRIYGNVQVAVDAATNADDVVRVAGICAGATPYDDGGTIVNQTVLITKPITIQGGYTITNNLNGSPDPENNPTILDALDSGRVVYVKASGAISGPVNVILNGLHLRGGQAIDGGAVMVGSGVVTLTHNQIYSNTATGNGGALYNEAGAVFVASNKDRDEGDNKIYGNTATNGGAIYNAGGQLTVDDNLLRNNQATSGGAFYHNGGAATLQNNLILNNAATDGAAIYNNAAGLTVLHNTIYSNDATGSGGGLYTADASPTVLNNIFAENTVAGAGAGHAVHSAVAYAIDYNNAVPAADAYSGNVTPGGNSYSDDPGFVDAAGGDFHLLMDSAMIDKGDPSVTLTTDFDNPADIRPGDQGFDLGADEVASCLAKIEGEDTIYGNIQTAIDNSSAGDTVLVTAAECRGVHAFDTGSETVTQTVHIDHDLTVTGGYNDSFSSITGRTTLNPVSAGRALFIFDTSVMTLTNFVAQRGDASGLGGGPSDNDAGGGIYLANSNLILENVEILSSTAAYGGGVYLDASSALTMTGSQVHTNTVGNSGGGIYNDGLINLLNSTEANAEQNEIFDNSAQFGGGIYNDNQALLQGSKIYNNQVDFLTTGRGGGFYNSSGSTATLDLGNEFYGNRANEGAAIYHAGGDNLRVWNTLIYENTGFVRGGGVFLADGAPSILHNTFYSNQTQSSTGQGGAVYIENGSPNIKNNIFDANTANQGNAIYGAAAGATIDYNHYRNGASDVAGSVSAGGTIFSGDPGLADPTGDPPNFHLLQSSPLINVADTSAVTNDFENDPRPVNSQADVGADEYNACLAKIHDEDMIYGRIQSAIDAASPGDQVDVAEGVCEENITIDKNITVDGSWEKDFSQPVMADGVRLIASTVDGTASGRVIDITGSASDVSLAWLTVSNGDAGASNGGGIRTNAANTTLSSMDVISNRAVDGGGIYFSSGITATVTDVSIGNSSFPNTASGNGGGVYVGSNSDVQFFGGGVSYNSAGGQGGGMYNASGSQVLMTGGASVQNNNAGSNGGGIYNDNAGFELRQKRVNENSADNGGGIYITAGSDALLVNLGLYSNTTRAGGDGGGLYDASSETQLYHASIWENHADNQGGGVYNSGGSMVISASIVASNTVSGAGNGIYGDASVDVTYSLRHNNDYVGVNLLGPGNIVGDPKIRDASGDLLYDSPAIDAVPNGQSSVAVDRNLDPRPQLCAFDMGRDEYAVGERKLTWAGPAPVDEATLTPTESVTYTFNLTNNSVNYRDLSPPWALEPGTGYTETITVTVDSSQSWSKIIEVVNGTNIITKADGLSAGFALRPGQVAAIIVETTVPTGTFSDAVDTTRLVAKGYQCTDGSARTDTSASATTTVQEGLNFVIAPDNAGAANPGETITYTHTLTNIGTITDTYQLVPKAGFYASAEIISPTLVTLGPGEDHTLTISVTIDPAAAGGLTDNTSAVAISQKSIEAGGEVLQKGAANATTVGFTSGTRYVALDGQDLIFRQEDEITDTEITIPTDNNCTQPDTAACRTLQQAVDQAASGDLIKINQGTYDVVGTDVITRLYQGITLTHIVFIDKGVMLRGGYDKSKDGGTGWDEEPPDHTSQPTILDPGQNGRTIFITDGPTTTVAIDRLTIRNGAATGLGGASDSSDAGGNIYNEGADVTLTANFIYDGQADYGAGLYSAGGDLLLQNNMFYRNIADLGGAINVESGDAVFENNTFYNNSHSGLSGGGAIRMTTGQFTATNNIFSNNGNAINVTGAVDAASTLDYNLYHEDGGESSGGFYAVDGSAVSPPPGSENVLNDPLFIDDSSEPPTLNLHLDRASPALEAGDPATTLDIDYDNDPRPLLPGGRVDIGADERAYEQSFVFYPDVTTSTIAGAPLTVTHILSNSGEITDTYTLTYTTNQPDWMVKVEPTLSSSIILAPNEFQTVVVTYTVPSTASSVTGVTVITATASQTSNFNTVVDTVSVKSTEWDIAKAANPADVVQPGDRLTYTLTITNVGDLDSGGVYTITDVLPEHTTFVSADPPAVTSASTVEWTFSDVVPISGTKTLTYSVDVSPVLTDGIFIVNETYSIVGGGVFTATFGPPVSVEVESSADLIITKTASHEPVRPGDVFTYTITITNSGTGGPAIGVVVTDTLPDETVLQGQGFISPATGSTNVSGDRVVWQLSSPIQPGENAQVTATVRVTSPLAANTLLTNTYSVTSPNIPAVVSDSITTLVTATNNITLNKTVTPSVVSAGGAVTYTITLTNSGDGIASVALTDTLSNEFTPSRFITDVVVPGRSWSALGVETVSFTATAPLTSGMYLNRSITATYGLSQTTLTDTAPVTVEAVIADFVTDNFTVDENSGPAVITVTLSGPFPITATVNYTTVSGTASTGVDYAPQSGVLTFAPGITVATYTVSITDDLEVEPDETVTQTLSGGSNVTVAAVNNPATLTILDDDLPEVNFESSAYTVEENVAAGQATITVTLSVSVTEPVTVGYQSADNTATAGSDYSAISSTVTFAPNTAVQTFTVPITDDLIQEGDETLDLTLVDPISATLGGTISATLTILDDDDPPDKPMLIAPANGTLTNTNNIDLIWSRVDQAMTYTLHLTPAGRFTVTNPVSGPVISSTILSDGVYTWTVESIDAAGRTSGITDTWVFTIDTVAPLTPTLVSPANGTVTNTNRITFAWTSSDDAAFYNLRITPESGGVMLLPVVNNSSPMTLVNGDGVYTWTVEAVDAAGNSSGYTDTWTLTLDTTPPPKPTLLTPPDGATITQSNTITFEWTSVADQLSNPVTYTLDISGQALRALNTTSDVVTLTDDGVYTWTVWVIDQLGHTAKADAFSFDLDTSPPDAPSLLSPPDGFLTNNRNITFDWTDVADSGPLTYTLILTNPGGTPAITPTTTSDLTTQLGSDGLYTWTVAAVDRFGRAAYTGTRTLTLDTTAPSLPTLLTPADGAIFTQSNVISFAWTASTDALSGPVAYTLNLSGQPPQVLTGLSRTLSLTDGVYSWYVSASDRAGNITSTASISFTVDLTPPEKPRLISPPDQTYTNNSLVNFRWSSVSDAMTYTLRYSGTTVNLAAPITSSAFVLAEDGVYDWTVRSVDAYSRTLGYTDTWQVIVDTTPPSPPSLMTPANGAVISDTARPAFTWSASVDVLSGPVNYTLILTDSTGLTSTFTSSSTTLTPATDLAAGAYTWSVRAEDRAGNASISPNEFSLTLEKVVSPLYLPIITKEDAPATPTKPDLIVTELTVTPNSDGSHQIQVTVINQSPISVAGPNNFHVAVYAVEDLTTPIVIWGVQGEWFGAGTGRTLARNYTLPGAATYNLRAWADPFNVVVETDDANNTKDTTVVVTAEAGAAPQSNPAIPSGPLPTPTPIR